MTYQTFLNESSLPRLPVPTLSSTINQLLTALKPLVSVEEYANLLEESANFLTSDLINLIQSHLESLSKNPDHSCYLNSINDETNPGIYGQLKGNILPRNPYLVLEEDPYGKTLTPPNQAERAANLINSSLKFIVSLRNATLKPDLTPKNGNPLTMNCYRNLFGTTRIPDDHHVTIKKYKDINDSRHIVIISNNQFYRLEVLSKFTSKEYEETKSKHKIWFSDHELSIILQGIADASEKVDTIESINNSLGSITTQSFSHWKTARQELTKSNKDTLDIIDNALFVVVLDSNTPTSDQDKTSVIAHGSSELLPGTTIQIGSCTSRWYDKLQLIITKNSVAGIVWESTSMDSTAILRFISDIFTDSVLKLAKNINGSEYTLFDNNITFISSSFPKPEADLIRFRKTPEVQHLIHLSETRLADIINQHEYKVMNIKLDTVLIKKLNLSIDSILQICFQITNYTLYGKMVNTLEPITTRKFKDARTELIPIQNETISNLVKLYMTNASSSEKWEKFKKCCSIHTQQCRDAMSGNGFERHFMSLVQVVKRPDVVEYLNKVNSHLKPITFGDTDDSLPLLCNPDIEKLTLPELLISNCGNPALRLFGIAPAIDQGFGIGYIIHNEKVIITVSSKFRQTERFMDTFKRVITDLKNMLKQSSNFIIDINDSERRKKEVQRLRVETELKNIEYDIPSKRHPVELALDNEQIPYEKIPDASNLSPTSMKQRSNSIESTNSNEYDLWGGYGYFDFGELDSRSIEISRNESFLNSHSNIGSTTISRVHSNTNLYKASLTNDLKEKLSLSERIRDQLSHSVDAFLSDSDVEETKVKLKSSIGRELDTSKFS